MNPSSKLPSKVFALRRSPLVGGLPEEVMECHPHQAAQDVAAQRPSRSIRPSAFTLVELLIVIAIIAIMASIVIAAFSNAAADSRGVLVRQQQAVVQEAINSWLAHRSAAPRSLSSARTEYNAATTGLARLALVQAYLDDATYAHLTANTSNADQVRSDAMIKTGQYLEITDWPSASYPKVYLH